MTTKLSVLKHRAWLFCAALLLLAACNRGSDPAQLVASAKAYVAKGDYSAATIQLKNALQKEPANGEARLLLGIALAETGDYVSAEKELRRALEYKQPAAAVYPELARTMLRLGEAKKLIEEFRGVTLANPAAQASLKTELGFAYASLGQYKEAREAFAAALVARPGDPRARVGEARLLAVERDLAGAMKIVDEVLAQSPAQTEALWLKAELLLGENKLEPAKETLAKLIAAQPQNAQAHFTLVSMLIGEKKFDEARTALDAMRKAAPRDVRGQYLEALLAFRQGDAAKARGPILEVLRGSPDHAPSQLLAGAIELQLGAVGTAEDYLRRVIARYPQNALARKLLASAYLRTGQPAKVEEVLEPVLKAAPNDTTALQFAGEAAMASGDYAKASAYYQRAANTDKDSAALRTRLAQVRFAGGDVDQAFKDLEAASSVDPGHYQADLALVLAHMRLREYDKAFAAVATLEKKQPTNPLTFNLKGGVYLAKGDRKNARVNFEKALELQADYVPAARNLARMDIADKQPELARKRFDAILAKSPRSEPALIGLAEFQSSTGAPPKEVEATLQRAVEANPTSPTARLALIRFHAQRRDTKNALAAAQAARAALPNDVRILEALGAAQLAAKEPNQAIATFQALVTALPQSPEALQRLASAQFAAKDYDAAIGSLRKAVAMSGDVVAAHRQISVVQLAAGRPEEALKEARALQQARPQEAVGLALEGEVLASQKKFGEAASAYADAVRKQPAAALVIRQHVLLVAAGKPAEADAVAARWNREHPKDTAVRFYIADRDLARKEYKAAAKGYREILALEPQNAIVLNNLAWTLAQLNDPAALGLAEKAFGLAPTSPAIADTLGWLLVEHGDAKRGLEILSRAAAAAPNVAEIRLHYAKALMKSGDKAAARKELEVVANATVDSPFKSEAQELLKQL